MTAHIPLLPAVLSTLALPYSVRTLGGAVPDVRPATRTGRVRTWKWLRWVGGTTLAAAVLMFCYLRIAGTTPVDSDGAGNALQGWDLLHGNLLLHGWWATDVSFWTTELPQYALVEAFAGLRPEVVHICAAMTYVLLVLLAVYAAKGRATGVEAAGRMLLALLILVAPEPGMGTYIALSSPDHVGTGVPVLLMLLFLDWAPRRPWVPPIVGLLLTWAMVGDPLVLVVGVLPVIAVCLTRAGVALHRSQATARELWFELSLAIAATLAMFAVRLVNLLVSVLGGFNVNAAEGFRITSQLQHLTSQLQHLPLDLRSALATFGADTGPEPGLWGGGAGAVPAHQPNSLEVAFAVVHLLGVAAIIMAVLLAGRRLARSLRAPATGPADLVSDLVVVAIALSLAIFFLTYPAYDLFAGREVGPLLSLGAVLAGRQLGGPLAQATLAGAGRPAVLLRSALAVVVTGYCAMLCYGVAQPQVPPANATLAAWLESHGLHNGLGGYWQGTSVTLNSGMAVTISPLFPVKNNRIASYSWEQDMRMFDSRTHSANFLVFTPRAGVAPTVKQAIAVFGLPAHTYRYQAYTILVWDKNLLADLAPATSPSW